MNSLRGNSRITEADFDAFAVPDVREVAELLSELARGWLCISPAGLCLVPQTARHMTLSHEVPEI